MNSVETDIDMHSEYRAIVQQPASILDSKMAQELGYIEHNTPWNRREPGMSKEAFILQVRRSDWALRRSEETLAGIVGWEKREVVIESSAPVACDEPV